MVKKAFKYTSVMLLACSALASCSVEEPAKVSTVGQKVAITVSADEGSQTKTVYDAANNVANWTAAEKIGVAAKCDDEFTDSIFQEFTGQNAAESRSTTFHGSVVDGGAGDYTLYAFSPYEYGARPNEAYFNLNPIQSPTSDSWDPRTDLMLGKGTAQTCATGVLDLNDEAQSINFQHMFGWLKMQLSDIQDDDAEARINYIRLSASSDCCGEFSIDFENQSISLVEGKGFKSICCNLYDRDIKLKDLGAAWFTMAPGTYDNIYVTVKLMNGTYAHFSRENLTIEASKITPATVTYHEGDVITDNMAAICGELPQMTSKTEGSLKILLLGHSFGEDASEFFPEIIKSAGITNVEFYRAITPDASLQVFYNYFFNGELPAKFAKYVENLMGDGKPGWNFNPQPRPISMMNIILYQPWDVIIFQTNTASCGITGTYVGQGDYSTYQPYLSSLMELCYVAGRMKYGKAPYLVWNVIQSYNTNRTTNTDIDYTQMYDAMISAAQSMKAESGIKCVLTPATALQEARTNSTDYGFDFTDASTYRLLLRDGWHASFGLGRYLESCTWFQQLIVPIYRGIDPDLTVIGNDLNGGFIPDLTQQQTSAGTAYFAADELDHDKALALQRIAVWTAANNPFAETNP